MHVERSEKSSPAVKFEEVSKFFGGHIGVADISFAIAEGETVSLLGPSGCGKTTTLRMVAGFERPDGGTISIGGQNVTDTPPEQRHVGIVFQNYALFPHFTVAENIAYGLKYRRYPKADIPARVSEVLNLVQLPHLAKRRPSQLSGGQQQRVALARALAFKPRVLLLDEPLSALDAKLRDELRSELKSTLKQVGTTTIIVTHDQDEAMSLSDRLFVMNAGRIVQQGRPDTVYAKPQTAFVAEFMGRINWLHGTIGEDNTRFVADSGLTIPLGDSKSITGPARLGIRPEHLSIEKPGAPCPEGYVSLAGKVTDVEHLGSIYRIWVTLASGERLGTVVTAAPEEDRRPGADVGLFFSTLQAHLFS